VLSADRRDIGATSPDSHGAKVVSAEPENRREKSGYFGFDTTVAQELLAIMTKSLDLMRDPGMENAIGRFA